MSVLAVQPRGGFPHIRVYTATATGILVYLRTMSNFIEIRNEGANELRVYTEEAEFTGATTSYIPIAAGELFVGPAQLDRVWLVSGAATTTARVISYCTH